MKIPHWGIFYIAAFSKRKIPIPCPIDMEKERTKSI